MDNLSIVLIIIFVMAVIMWMGNIAKHVIWVISKGKKGEEHGVAMFSLVILLLVTALIIIQIVAR